MVESGYSKRAIELYANNVNMGTMLNPSITTPFLGPCGDLIELYLKIDKNGTIEDAKFYYLGCPGSAASASAMTVLLKGKTLAQAKQMTKEDILIELDGLPPSKLDCAELCIKTLRKAIAEYKLIRSRLGT